MVAENSLGYVGSGMAQKRIVGCLWVILEMHNRSCKIGMLVLRHPECLFVVVTLLPREPALPGVWNVLGSPRLPRGRESDHVVTLGIPPGDCVHGW